MEKPIIFEGAKGNFIKRKLNKNKIPNACKEDIIYIYNDILNVFEEAKENAKTNKEYEDFIKWAKEKIRGAIK